MHIVYVVVAIVFHSFCLHDDLCHKFFMCAMKFNSATFYIVKINFKAFPEQKKIQRLNSLRVKLWWCWQKSHRHPSQQRQEKERFWKTWNLWHIICLFIFIAQNADWLVGSHQYWPRISRERVFCHQFPNCHFLKQT